MLHQVETATPTEAIEATPEATEETNPVDKYFTGDWETVDDLLLFAEHTMTLTLHPAKIAGLSQDRLIYRYKESGSAAYTYGDGEIILKGLYNESSDIDEDTTVYDKVETIDDVTYKSIGDLYHCITWHRDYGDGGIHWTVDYMLIAINGITMEDFLEAYEQIEH